MRHQGRITKWKDDRGFGFITPSGGGARVFVHISGFGQGQRRPSGNEPVTYELVKDVKKGNRAESVLYIGSRQAPTRLERLRFLRLIIPTIVLTAIGFYAWQHFEPTTSRVELGPGSEPAMQINSNAKFLCQGKHYCSEMISCEEATLYLKNCPGVKLDGDGDGIPCESQWCGP